MAVNAGEAEVVLGSASLIRWRPSARSRLVVATATSAERRMRYAKRRARASRRPARAKEEVMERRQVGAHQQIPPTKCRSLANRARTFARAKREQLEQKDDLLRYQFQDPQDAVRDEMFEMGIE